MNDEQLLAEIRETEQRLERCDDYFIRVALEHKLESLRRSVGFDSLEPLESPERLLERSLEQLRRKQ